jgi:hypothetical protein
MLSPLHKWKVRALSLSKGKRPKENFTKVSFRALFPYKLVLSLALPSEEYIKLSLTQLSFEES